MRKGAAFEAAAERALVAGEHITSRGICWAAQAPPGRWLLFVMRRQYQIVLTDHRLLVFRRRRKPPTSRDLILAKRYDAFIVEKVTRWRPLMYVRLRAPNGTKFVFEFRPGSRDVGGELVGRIASRASHAMDDDDTPDMTPVTPDPVP
jgi:hypothetical protein